MKSAKDTGLITELAIWLYVYDYKREAVSVCDLFKNESFDGNYTLWDNIDHAWCLKARILREQGDLNESKQIIEFVNQYRKPEGCQIAPAGGRELCRCRFRHCRRIRQCQP